MSSSPRKPCWPTATCCSMRSAGPRAPENVPELKLQMGRQASLFAARNDMDQSQEIENVSGGIYDKMLGIVEKWKTDFNFVGSYYVNIGIGTDTGTGDQRTDWNLLKPFYDQLLAMGNEIGTYSYTHPANTNDLTPEEIQAEFEGSKLCWSRNSASGRSKARPFPVLRKASRRHRRSASTSNICPAATLASVRATQALSDTSPPAPTVSI